MDKRFKMRLYFNFHIIWWSLENQHVRKRDKSSWDTLGRLKVNWIVFLPIIVKWLSLGGLHFWGFDDLLYFASFFFYLLRLEKKGWLINDLRDWRWAPDALGGNEEPFGKTKHFSDFEGGSQLGKESGIWCTNLQILLSYLLNFKSVCLCHIQVQKL